jgi:negative regulator of sigma E activity
MLYDKTWVIVEYKGLVWNIEGYKMNADYANLVTLDGKQQETVHKKYYNVLDCLKYEIEDVYTYEDLKEKYPEYAI